jgi:integrase/recombinase XerD
VDWSSSVSTTGSVCVCSESKCRSASSGRGQTDDGSVVELAESFLAHLHVAERSPNTVKAYAHYLRDWFEFLD